MTTPTPPGRPGLQYPRLPANTDPAMQQAVRNIFDNLFYIRENLATPVTSLTPQQLTQVQRIIGAAINNVFNTINNITNNITVSGCIVGSHALRLSSYGAAAQQDGTLFFETDRKVFYVIVPTPKHWEFGAGCSVGLEANLWTDLGSNDAGFLYFASDTETLWIWNGSAWVEAGGGGLQICYIPMVTGAEPIEIMSTGAGQLLLVAIDVPQ